MPVTIPALIDTVLLYVRTHFYADQPSRNFLRDRGALMQAVARYGYACEQRGWNLDAKFIQGDLIKLLRDMRERRAEIKYLPVYLEKTVDRSIRLRAEELSALAKAKKAVPALVTQVVAGAKTVAVVEPTDVEILGALYADLRARRNVRRRQQAAPAAKEMTLL